MKNNDHEYYNEIKKPARIEFKVKGSRFIATAKKVDSPEQAQNILEEIRREFHDATHNCYAWKTGLGKKKKFRYSDDGEPNHTAGLPIFKAIEAQGLSNIIIIVTRYFGGVKLGTGGLIRAYGKAAAEVLKECETAKNFPVEILKFTTAFEFVSLVHNVISTFHARLINAAYNSKVEFTVEVRTTKLKAFLQKLRDGTNGQIATTK